MNPTIQSPVRPALAPPTPAIPVSTKPEPVLDYALARRAALPVVPPIPFRKAPSSDEAEPDVLKALDKAAARVDKLSREVADYRARLKETQAREAETRKALLVRCSIDF
jgi:hypothetical protein